MISSVRRVAPVLLLVLAIACTILVYQRGLYGSFIFDDWPNIAHNVRIAIDDLEPGTLKRAAFSSQSGIFNRPVSMLSFAFNYYATGFDPFYFKLTNVIIHVLNGIGLFVLTTLLLNIYRKRFQPALTSAHARWVALAVASAWLLHPFNLTGVLYVVQRMASLSALFSIWGLVVFLWGRIRFYKGQKGMPLMLLSVLVFMPLAVFSKENGALLPILAFVVEITLFNFQTQRPSGRRFLTVFYLFTVAVPVSAALIYLATHIEILVGGYTVRDFTLSERLMTEARVLWFYLYQIVLPSTSEMGLYHDDIIISRSVIEPLNTLFASLGILALAGIALMARKKVPVIAFGLLFFFAGHVMESSILALELVHEHRNYLPMYGVLLILFYYLLYPLNYTQNLRVRQAAVVLLIGLFALNTFTRAGKWSNRFDLVQAEVENHPDSPRANGEVGDLYNGLSSSNLNDSELNYIFAHFHYLKATELGKNTTHGLFGLIKLSAVKKKPTDPEWISELTRRLEQPPYAIDNGPKLVDLIQCQMAGVCKLLNRDIEGLLQASLRNPAITNWSRANVYSALHLYRFNLANDYPGAVAALHQAIEAMPGALEYRLNLIKFLVLNQKVAEAAEQLVLFKQLDMQQAHLAETTRLGKLLLSRGN